MKYTKSIYPIIKKQILGKKLFLQEILCPDIAEKAVPGQFVHNLCIPLQQVCRVVAQGYELEEEEWALLEKINDTSYIIENYEGGCADPMKSWVEYGDQDYLVGHKGE